MGLTSPWPFPFKFSQVLGRPWNTRWVWRKGTLSSLHCGASTFALRATLSGGWCQGQADRARKGVWDGGEAAPAPKSQGYLGTSVRVTCISGCQPRDPETGLTYHPSGLITPVGVA